MRKPRQLLIALGCVAAVAVLLAISMRPAEPYYLGRPYSQWLDDYHNSFQPVHSPTPTNPEPLVALQAIGTNAIPTLLRWVRRPPTAWQDRVEPIANALPSRLARLRPVRVILQLDDPNPYHNHYNTALAFDVLGTNANCAVPALTRLMHDPSAKYDGFDAACALAAIGPAALPPLMAAAADPTARCRISAISFLSDMGSNALPAIPLLVHCLGSTNQTVTQIAAYSLCRLRLRPDLVFPVLTNHLQSLDPDTRIAAAQWLGEFEIHRPLARSLLTAALNDPSDTVKQTATSALDKIAPEVFTNTPAQ